MMFLGSFCAIINFILIFMGFVLLIVIIPAAAVAVIWSLCASNALTEKIY